MALAFPGANICVVISPDDRWFDNCISAPNGVRVLRDGGESREATVRNAVDSLIGPDEDDWVLVHDAVRPCIDLASLLRLQIDLADDTVGGLLAIPVSDALKMVAEDHRVETSHPRAKLWRAQTPQMFRYGLLRKALAHPGIERWTDEASAIEVSGLQPRIVMGSGFNVKITFPEDLELASAIMTAQAHRGY